MDHLMGLRTRLRGPDLKSKSCRDLVLVTWRMGLCAGHGAGASFRLSHIP